MNELEMIPYCSVVIPLKNEAENIHELLRKLHNVLLKNYSSSEIILINDHSTDNTVEIAKKIIQENRTGKCEIALLNLSSKTGKDEALLMGIKYANSNIIITMDGDCQNDPNDIPRLYASYNNANMVCGFRTGRKDTLRKRTVSWIANVFRKLITMDYYNDAGCAMRIFPKSLGREIAKHTPFLYGTAHCFYPSIAKIYGLRIVEVPINHNRRNHGDSKFGLMRGRLIEGFLSCLYIKKVKKIKIQFEE